MAFARCSDAPLDVVSGETYNLGDSRMNFTLGHLAEKVLAEFPATRVEYVENSDRRNYRVSFEKIHNQIGFECQWTLEDGIREIKRAFESKFITDYRDARYSNLQFLKLCGTPLCKDELDRHLMAALANIPAPARRSVANLGAVDSDRPAIGIVGIRSSRFLASGSGSKR